MRCVTHQAIMVESAFLFNHIILRKIIICIEHYNTDYNLP